MEKNYEITDKQIDFLNGFLQKKHPNISDETKIELVDHLISDFEATTENGNLSQYLSNEMNFVKTFVFNSVKNVKKEYGKLIWKKFFDFFRDINLIPYTLFIILFFYFLSTNFNQRTLFITLVILQSILMLMSCLFGMINKKPLRKLDEVKFLGAEIWLPYILVQLLSQEDIGNFILSNSYLYTIYASFAIIYAIAAYLILRSQRKIILEKYIHLLN